MRFILIDKLLRIVPGHVAVAVRRFPVDEPFFADHFPGFPIVPGTLLMEAMAQTGGWLLHATHGRRMKTYLAMVERSKFRAWVRPDDEARIEARLLRSDSAAAMLAAEVIVEGRTVASGRLAFGLAEIDASGPFSTPEMREWIERTFVALGGPDALALGNQAIEGGG
jgi:3-hydroxyacyl-[acyl-carrier-protein] dehydratase